MEVYRLIVTLGEKDEPGGERMKTPPLFRIEPFRGMNLSSSPTQISPNESPDCLNVNVDLHGALNKRTGYERVMNLGTSPIKGMFLYRKSNGQEIFLVASGGKLYTSGVPNRGTDYSTWDALDLTQTWEDILL